jgi:hypothetical protein
MDSSNPQFTPVQQPKKSNTGMIIAIVVVVLLCCCCLVVAGGGLYLRSKTSNLFSSINQGLNSTPEIPSMPSGGSDATPGMPSVPSNLVPQGGRGDDVQRATAWGYVVTSSALSGCNASDASKTTIEITSQPDSAGVWTEKWTVTCMDSSKTGFDVTFTPKNGTTTVSVSASK